jgi:hypothetical protein
VAELASPICPSPEGPSYYSDASNGVLDDLPDDDNSASQTERFITDCFRKFVASKPTTDILPIADFRLAQQAYEASPAPVRQSVAQRVGMSPSALRERIYGDVSVYGLLYLHILKDFLTRHF